MNLCETCQRLDIRALALKSRTLSKDAGRRSMGNLEFAMRTGLYANQHESVSALMRAAASCDFCAELWRCFLKYGELSNAETEHDLVRSSNAGPIYLVFGQWRDASPQLVALQNAQNGDFQVLALWVVYLAPGRASPSEFQYSFPRMLSHYSGSDQCLSLIRETLSYCSRTHKKCRSQLHRARLPARIIDVHSEPRLVEGEGRSEPYTALSYSWGCLSAAMLTASTENQFRIALPAEALPPTMADAVTVIRAIGLRFIWIDALCIFQDSEADFAAQTSNMGNIYRGAALTICGSSQERITDHLFEYRDSAEVRLPWRDGKQPQEYVYLQEYSREDRTAESSELKYSHLNTRGWCLQETLLATRSLWIGKQQFIFQCVQMQAEEGATWSFNIGSEPYRSKDMMHQLIAQEKKWLRSWRLRAWGIPPVLHIPYFTVDWPLLSKTWNPRDLLLCWTYSLVVPPRLGVRGQITVYDSWERIIEQYSQRHFTRPIDVLPALSGLADAFQRATGEKYLAGNFEGGLPHCLNWECSNFLDEEETKAQEFIKANDKLPYLAPSWSWASLVRGRVLFYPRKHSSRLQRILASASVVDVWTKPATQNRLGAVEEGQITLDAPFISISDPTNVPVLGNDLYYIHRMIHRQICHPISGPGLEYQIKHRPHEGQRFGLVRTGLYQKERLRKNERWANRLDSMPFPSTVSAETLLVETCHDADCSRSVLTTATSSVEGLKWRRVAHVSVELSTEVPTYSDDGVADDNPLKAEMAKVEWVDMRIRLV